MDCIKICLLLRMICRRWKCINVEVSELRKSSKVTIPVMDSYMFSEKFLCLRVQCMC